MSAWSRVLVWPPSRSASGWPARPSVPRARAALAARPRGDARRARAQRAADERVALLEAGFADYDALSGGVRPRRRRRPAAAAARCATSGGADPARRRPLQPDRRRGDRGRAGPARAARARVRRRVGHAAAPRTSRPPTSSSARASSQRDLWLGGSRCAGCSALDRGADPTALALAVVPFGVPAEPPRPPAAGAAGPRSPATARGPRAAWGGGIWDWLDAPTVIRAARPAARRPSTSSSRASAAGGSSPRRARARRPRRSPSPRRGLEGGACTSTTAGCPTRSAAPGCSRPTSASPPTPRTSRRASPPAPGCRLPVGRPAGGGDRRRRARRARRGPRPRPRRRRRATPRRSRPPARSCSTDPGPASAASASPARRGRCAGTASWSRCASSASGAKRPPSRRGARDRRADHRPISADRPRDARPPRTRQAGAQARRARARERCAPERGAALESHAMSAAARRTPGAAGACATTILGLDRVELGALVVLIGLSFVVLAALLTKGRPLSGADGLLAADQLQYFAWIREASHHVLIGNRFDLAPGDRAFLHPGFAISGGLHALGLSVPLSYLGVEAGRHRPHVLRRPRATCAGSFRPAAAPRRARSSRCSRSCPPRGSSRGRTGAATRASTRSTSSPARCGPGSTCGAT